MIWFENLELEIWFDVEVSGGGWVAVGGMPLTIRSSLGRAAQRESNQPALQSVPGGNTRRPSYRECSKEYKAAIEEIYG